MIGFKRSQVLSLMQSVSLRRQGRVAKHLTDSWPHLKSAHRLALVGRDAADGAPFRKTPLQDQLPSVQSVNNLNSTARNRFNRSIIPLWYHLPLYFRKLRICVFFVWHKMAVLEHSRFSSLEEYGSCTGREEGPCSRAQLTVPSTNLWLPSTFRQMSSPTWHRFQSYSKKLFQRK